MKKEKIKYQNLNAAKKLKNEEIMTVPDEHSEKREESVIQSMEEFFQEDPTVFLLNNILMSVQFFENYDREIEILRKDWYKDYVLQNHHKKCFFADSLFKRIGTKVTFRPRHGINKSTKNFIHPLRIFISDDKVEAAYDPAVFGQAKSKIIPFYQFTVKPCDDNKKEKSGYVFLAEFKSPESSTTTTIFKRKTPLSNPNALHQSILLSRENETYEESFGIQSKTKSTIDIRNIRKLTKTEKLIAQQNKNLSSGTFERRVSVKYLIEKPESTIPNFGFYNYLKPEERLQQKFIHDVRMNSNPQISCRIPRKCFQVVEIKKAFNTRRSALTKSDRESCFATKNFLNSAAFKGHFCDILIEKLAEPLNFDSECVNKSTVLEEYIVINQDGILNYVTPVIKILDWEKHIKIFKTPKLKKKLQEIEWPTAQMKAIMSILPCFLVPNGFFSQHEENLDYEKEWKLVFPKAEEFLLLHMMHSHLRVYFFLLTIYKTFIEPETNPASFGPKHLVHLLFWLVHEDFLAWPEDRLGEILIRVLKNLYKKLQNKSLHDFFITQRNLFSDSFLKDLHKTQSIIKKIIENPLPYVMRAIRNLQLEPNFYPTLDLMKLNTFLKEDYLSQKQKKEETMKGKKQRAIHWADDEELQWKKNAMKQINKEKKIEEGERLKKLSIESIDIEDIPKIEHKNANHCKKIVENFIFHFLEMGQKSAEFKALNQALMYLNHSQKLIQLLSFTEANKTLFLEIKEKVNKLREHCGKLKRNPSPLVIEDTITNKDLNQKKSHLTINITEKNKKEINLKNNDSDEEFSTDL